jgi:hypothetical protein
LRGGVGWEVYAYVFTDVGCKGRCRGKCEALGCEIDAREEGVVQGAEGGGGVVEFDGSDGVEVEGADGLGEGGKTGGVWGVGFVGTAAMRCQRCCFVIYEV